MIIVTVRDDTKAGLSEKEQMEIRFCVIDALKHSGWWWAIRLEYPDDPGLSSKSTQDEQKGPEVS